MQEAPRVGSDPRGTEFGPYTIARRLGFGGMAETFEAVRHGPEGFAQRVCLKLALPFLREDEAFVRLFQREARLAAKLRHSNIVGILDYGTVDGTPYMALELVDGVDLLTLLEKHTQLSFEHVALLAIELAKALSHAHNPPSAAGVDDESTGSHGIIHRDVSPSNVMLSHQGEVMLTDFGVAKAISGASCLRSAVKGKVPYMAPEQLRNEPLDGRADLFSLGVVLFESLSGARPFEGGNDPTTIMRILQGEHIPLCEVAREAPEGFCNVVDSLLESDRDQRPSTASELIEQLDEFAPSPRVQQNLGTIVGELRQESLAVDEEPEIDSFGQTVREEATPASGVIRSQPQPPLEDEEAEPRGFPVNASAVLAVTVVVAMLAAVIVLAVRAV
jgi:serine/threonine protein kinase